MFLTCQTQTSSKVHLKTATWAHQQRQTDTIPLWVWQSQLKIVYWYWSSWLCGFNKEERLDFCWFYVIICFFSSPPQRPLISDFEEISIPDFIHYTFCPILILQKEPVFPFFMLSAKQGNYRYHFYNVFGMTRSLTGDWTRDLPNSKPAIYN